MYTNSSLQLSLRIHDTGENPSVQRPPLELRKPSLHGIQPRGAGGRETKVDSRLADHPRGDFFGFVGAEIIHHFTGKVQIIANLAGSESLRRL